MYRLRDFTSFLVMEDRLMRTAVTIALLVAALCWSTTGFAQASFDRFNYQVTPYLWTAGLDGIFGARNRTADVDASFKDVLDHLDFVAMGAFEARWDKVSFIADTLYVHVSDQKGLPSLNLPGPEVTSKVFFFDPELAYSVFRGEQTDLSVTGGMRTWRLKNELQPTSGAIQQTFSHSRAWIDPIVGLKFNHDLSNRFYLTSKADIGGFSAAARLDWQAFGGLGMKFNERIGGTVGYRYLAVDYKNEGFVFDTALKGVIVGIAVHF
jgi:hypothetical protein